MNGALQRRDVTVFCAANEIALPMTGNGAVLDFSGPFPDGDGIYDSTARVFKDTRMPRAAYAALGSQVPHQLFLQHTAGLDEQAVVNRFVGHARALVIGVANQGASWRSSGVAAEYDFEQIGRGRLTNHALVAMSAARTGVTVVTANARDFQRAGEISPILLER